MKFGPLVQEAMSFERFLIWSSCVPPVQLSGTICAILLEGILGTILCYNFDFGPVVQEEMPFKDISYLERWRLFCLGKQNHLCNFGRVY